MKIEVIRGRNIASLEGNYCVDFTVEPLLSAGIFAICGPTGAGKSTVLDTMCLALYGKTPRTEQARENNVKLKDVNDDWLAQSDSRFLLRRGAAFGFAEVEFIAVDGNRYRSRWEVSRAREKESGRLQNVRVSLCRLYENGTESPFSGNRQETQNRICELVGLTFEQFTRSVLLAQNDFSTFLKAEQGEKASLLEKLTGTEHYSAISKLVYQKYADAKNLYERARLQLSEIDLLTEEQRNGYLSSLEKVVACLKECEKLSNERNELQEALKNTLEQYELLLRKKEESEKELADVSVVMKQSREELEVCKEKVSKLETEWEDCQPELLRAGQLDTQIMAVRKNVDILQSKKETVEKKYADSVFKLSTVRESCGKIEKQIQDVRSWLEHYRLREPIVEQFSALKLHLQAAGIGLSLVRSLEQQQLAYEKERQRLDTLLKCEKDRLQQFVQQGNRLEEEIAVLEKKLETTDIKLLEDAVETHRSVREKLSLQLAEIVTTGSVKELRDRLSKGKPCPVCGSTEHPYLTSHIDLRMQELALSVEQETERMEKAKVALALARDEEKKLGDMRRTQLRLQKQLSEQSLSCNRICSEQELLESKSEENRKKSAEAGLQFSKSCEEVNVLFGNSDWQKSWMKEPERFCCVLEEFVLSFKQHKEDLSRLEPELARLCSEEKITGSFVDDLQLQVAAAVSEYEDKHQELTGMISERAGIFSGESVELVRKKYAEKKQLMSRTLDELQQRQEKMACKMEQLKGVLLQITRSLDELQTVKVRQQAALDTWNGKYSVAESGELFDDRVARLNREKTEYEYHLRIHNENQEKVAKLQKKMEKIETDNNRWAKLNELVGSADGAKFRKIAQGYTLDVLLAYANIQLNNLTKRYRLERVPGTLALQVIDNDMCDEVRTVHSLSGGESFLVSLALALGLSALSSNRMNVESLFIDEGFGSLDAETLRIAMDALENLRMQGRKICVISHVQEMTERMPVRIVVEKKGNGCSHLVVTE